MSTGISLCGFASVLKNCDFLTRHALFQFDVGNVQKRSARMVRQRSDADEMMTMTALPDARFVLFGELNVVLV